MATFEELHQWEIRLSSNIELLKNLKKQVLFNNQIERNLSENDDEVINFNDVLDDLEDIRNEIDCETLPF